DAGEPPGAEAGGLAEEGVLIVLWSEVESQFGCSRDLHLGPKLEALVRFDSGYAPEVDDFTEGQQLRVASSAAQSWTAHALVDPPPETPKKRSTVPTVIPAQP